MTTHPSPLTPVPQTTGPSDHHHAGGGPGVTRRRGGWQLGSAGASARGRAPSRASGNRLPDKTLAPLPALASAPLRPAHTPRIALQERVPANRPEIPMDGGGHGGAPDDADAAFFSRRRYRCCCFSAPWQSSSSSSHARRAGPTTTDEEWWHQVGEGTRAGAERRRWWRRGVDALMKVREWSELVAGPRWKTFIRRFRRGHHRHGAGAGAGGGRKLNYDALSYALNFDEGHGATPEGAPGGELPGYPDFSARFAAPLGSARSSMDLGGRDAPSLFHHPLPQQPHTPPAAAAARG
ncbi:uncharacterized protein LOC119333316 [Triticum dicoccoides]|uniref:uncharacterized protein LOC119333316 n=1 Tax=Triticum dicoccoides TaxID=85692 RepID=UPI001891BCA3|nr:uncharacterized protein LOC119333316 [Triticum dicoccoides]